MSIPVTGTRPLEEGLVLHLKLNEGDGLITHDISGNRNHGTISEAAWTDDGEHGMCLTFDGEDDLISVADDASLRLETADFTIAIWFKTVAEPTDNYPAMIGKGDAEVGEWMLRILRPSNTLIFYANAGIWLSTSNDYVDEEWHHAVIVRDGNDGVLYVDGESVATGAGFDEINLNTAKALQVGCADSSGFRYWDGLLGEVRIYKERALTEEEIKLLYIIDSQPDLEADLVLNLKFNEGDGTIVHDYSDERNNGAFDGAPVWTEDEERGLCLTFDGDDKIVVTKVTSNWIDTITISLWMYSIKDNVDRMALREPGALSIYQRGSDSALAFAIVIGGSARYGYIYADDWTASEWTHIVMTVTATTAGGDGKIRVYKDGSLHYTSAAYTGDLSASIPTYVGSADATTRYWIGRLDEIRIYDRVLSDEEIKLLARG